jgi:hypothetical protein
MPAVVSALLAFVTTLFQSHTSLYLENLVLRHQIAVYRQTVRRPRLRAIACSGRASHASGQVGKKP